MGTASNVFQLFDVGLYEGPVAPAFVVPDYASELALCQRYFEWVQIAVPGFCPSTTIARTGFAPKVPKRITLTLSAKAIGSVTINNPGGNPAATSFNVTSANSENLYLDVNTSGLTLNAPCIVNFGANNAYVNARL
jgi:hypothetical protein